MLPDEDKTRGTAPKGDARRAKAAPAEMTDASAMLARVAEDVRLHQEETNSGHAPVMLREVLQALAPQDGEIHVDGTFGAGGYSRALLTAARCDVYAIDRDPAAAPRAATLAAEFGQRLHMMPGCFGDVADLLAAHKIENIDGFVLDLGVSSMQLDMRERGFSFREDGPLDMRMGDTGPTAADLVNTLPEQELADIIYAYGDEKASRRIAKRIVAARATAPVTTTKQLVKIIHDVLPMHGGIKTDTATRTFQALRIAVNDELGELERALVGVLPLMREGGRIAIVSFHSLEDSRVKHFFRQLSGGEAAPSRHLPQQAPQKNIEPPLRLIGKQQSAAADETARNPRARSARLRVAVRTAAPLPATYATVFGGRHA